MCRGRSVAQQEAHASRNWQDKPPGFRVSKYFASFYAISDRFCDGPAHPSVSLEWLYAQPGEVKMENKRKDQLRHLGRVLDF